MQVLVYSEIYRSGHVDAIILEPKHLTLHLFIAEWNFFQKLLTKNEKERQKLVLWHY